MKKILYSIMAATLMLTGCISFDDPTVENYGNGPAVQITTGAVEDDAFTFTITPASGTQFYSFVVAKGTEPQALDAANLLSGKYKGVAGSVIEAEKAATYTFDMKQNGIGICSPNTSYVVYAVAANDKGITGDVVSAVVLTTDGGAPAPKSYKRDAENKAVILTMSEPVTRAEGAVTAEYYKEWDILNPVTLADEDIVVTVNGTEVTFAAPTAPAGAYVTFSYAEGAFKDSFGNKCKALNSGLDMTSGKFKNLFIQVTPVPFDITDENIKSPENGSVFPEWDKFTGVIEFDFNIFRNDETVENGDLSVVYTTAKKTSTLKLSANDWSVEGKTLIFHLPEAPEAGAIVTLKVVEGAFCDVYGNPNNAFTSKTSWKYFAMTKNMVLGDFKFSYISAYDNEQYDCGTITITEYPNVENGLIINNLYLEGSKILGRYDIEKGKLYVSAYYSLGLVPAANGGNYGLITYSMTGKDEIEFTVNPDGTIISNDLAIVACDENFESALGYWEKCASATFTPAQSSSKAKAKTYHGNHSKVNLKNVQSFNKNRIVKH